MLTIINCQNLSKEAQKSILSRPKINNNIKDNVASIILSVKNEGDDALKKFTLAFDKQSINSILVPNDTILNATISNNALEAIRTAINTISIYHNALIPEVFSVNTAPGVNIQRIYRPIEKVGFYVPGGNNTPLVSSLLMQAIPAKIAGCKVRVLCTPVNSDGRIDPHLLVAARLCEIDCIYQIGGAQAIAAMAYGTESVTKVDKLFGPGNAWVTEAKSQISIDPEGAAIDLPAGPSEVMVIADDKANPAFVAADLLAQAEHGIDSHVVLICESESFAQKVLNSLNLQCTQLSREPLIRQALKHSAILISPTKSAQLDLINYYAPEHLIINRLDANDWVSDIQCAGTIFLGPFAAETLGDYVTGSNHVLPTYGFARSYSGLGLGDFLKTISVQSISKEGIIALGHAAETLARLEGLDAHANAIKIRLTALESE